MKISISVYRIIGAVLVACGIIGYFTVADELHHMGEFIGVSSVLLAGIILLIVGRGTKLKTLAIQWIAYGLLVGIPLGGIVLDNMPLGVGLGLCLGIVVSVLQRKDKSATNP